MFRAAIILCFIAVAYGVETCEEMAPFCTDDGATQFEAGVDTFAQDGVDYGCLSTRPNPSWYYMIIGDSGDLEIGISSVDNLDVDFAMWGPFASHDAAVAACPNEGLGSPIDCSWDAATTELANIASSNTGEVYVLVITNYADTPNDITFAKSAGTATTDCSVLDECEEEPVLTDAYEPTTCAIAQPNDRCFIYAATGYRAQVDLGYAVCSFGEWEWEWSNSLDTASIDIDENAEGSCNCGSNTFCTNTIGSYDCQCLTGYESNDGTNCVDIDECATGANTCGDYSTCTNTDGSYFCSCWAGYEYVGGEFYTCADINECADASACPDNSDCVNTDGAYECYCHVGYEMYNGDCVDSDECAMQIDECHMYADCMNTVGSYECECWVGYEGDGMDCEFIELPSASASPSAEPVQEEDCVEEVVSEVNVIFAYIFRGLKVEPDCEDTWGM